MTDLDRYLTDEVMDKASRAAWPLTGYQESRMEKARIALTAVLPDIIQQAKAEAINERAAEMAKTSIYSARAIGQTLSRCVDLIEQATRGELAREAKAEALREAAQKYQWGGWAERNPAVHASLAARRLQSEHAVAWLRGRADQIEAGR